MNTSIVALALSAALLGPSWRSSYTQAQQDAAQQRKPMVVVFGSGPNGWTRIVRDQSPSVEVNKLMAEQYVCYYVDTATQEGGRLAQNFQIQGSVGMVISDRAGSTQAFWHQGDLTHQNAVHYLQKYSDPHVHVAGTETLYTAQARTFANNIAPAPIRTVNC
jgi:hypothetical protein